MRINKVIIIVAFLSLSLVGRAGEGFRASIYNGTQIKLDIASPIITPAINQWKMQQYEIAANVQLIQRLFPTIELGYAGGQTHRGDSIAYNGQGGFMRIGCDLNPLKKYKDSPHALLVGIRFGTAVQGFEHRMPNINAVLKSTRADVWGEIVLGCQVEIAKFHPHREYPDNRAAFYMGWFGRFKILFTRQNEYTPTAKQYAIYIPGFGPRDNTGWGVNYYLGWKF